MKKFHDISSQEPKNSIKSAPDIKRKRPKKKEHSDLFWSEEDETRFERLKKPRKDYSKFKHALYRGVAVLIVLSAFFGFSFAKAISDKDDFETNAQSMQAALADVMSDISNGDLKSAMQKQNDAYERLQTMKLYLDGWGQNSMYLSMIGDSRSKLLNMEKLLSGASGILEALVSLEKSLGDVLEGNNQEDQIVDFTLLISSLDESISKSLKKLESTEDKLRDVNTKVLDGYEKDIDQAIGVSKFTRKSLEELKIVITEDLTWLSGIGESDKNVLLVFQNNAELRGGSAGSLGSFGIAKFSNGNLTNIDFGKNIFKIDQEFEKTRTISPPSDLSWVIPDGKWTLKDAGWAVNGVQAMEKIRWFYEEETSEKIDGVVILDTTAFLKLLEFSGPIHLPEYDDIKIDKDNFREIVEHEVHEGYFEREGNMDENEPKKILSDMMPKFMDQLFSKLNDKQNAIEFLMILKSSLSSKDILLYMDNMEFQKRLSNYNFSGEILKDETGDYLYINNSNVDGYKSSLNVNETISLNSRIKLDGLIENSLNVKREHTGRDKWPDGTNRNLVRLILPERVKVNNFAPKAGDFNQHENGGLKDGKYFWQLDEVDNEGIGYWQNTKPSEISEVNIDYVVDSDIDMGEDSFIFPVRFQKQPGSNFSYVSYTLNYPDGFRPKNVAVFNEKDRKIEFKFELNKDIYYTILFEKINR